MYQKTTYQFDDLPSNSNIVSGTYTEQLEDEINQFDFYFYRNLPSVIWKKGVPNNAPTKETILKQLKK